MRKFDDRPIYLSKWSDKELIDGLSRGKAYLGACGPGSEYDDLKAEVDKRRARKERAKALRQKNAADMHALDILTQDTWSNYTLANWPELKEALVGLKNRTAKLRGSDYQAVHVGIHRAMARLRAGVPLRRRVLNRKVSPFIEFWKICLPLGQDIADAQLAKLLAAIDLKRMIALGHTPTTA